jgi:hypothetical protein
MSNHFEDFHQFSTVFYFVVILDLIFKKLKLLLQFPHLIQLIFEKSYIFFDQNNNFSFCGNIY